MITVLKRWHATRQLRRFAAEMSHERAAAYMRMLAEAGGQRSALVFAERARDTAPTPEMARHYERWVIPLRAGRRIKVGTYPALILEPVPDDLVEAVEEAFEEGDN